MHSFAFRIRWWRCRFITNISFEAVAFICLTTAREHVFAVFVVVVVVFLLLTWRDISRCRISVRVCVCVRDDTKHMRDEWNYDKTSLALHYDEDFFFSCHLYVRFVCFSAFVQPVQVPERMQLIRRGCVCVRFMFVVCEIVLCIALCNIILLVVLQKAFKYGRNENAQNTFIAWEHNSIDAHSFFVAHLPFSIHSIHSLGYVDLSDARICACKLFCLLLFAIFCEFFVCLRYAHTLAHLLFQPLRTLCIEAGEHVSAARLVSSSMHRHTCTHIVEMVSFFFQGKRSNFISFWAQLMIVIPLLYFFRIFYYLQSAQWTFAHSWSPY